MTSLIKTITRWVAVGYPYMPEPAFQEEEDGIITETYIYHDTEGFVHLGWCPAPVTWWQKFRYHVGNGLVMQYPLWKVVIWSLVNTNGSFRDADDPQAGWAEAIEASEDTTE